jgi:peptide/nickel transport system substrate-binding protein
VQHNGNSPTIRTPEEKMNRKLHPLFLCGSIVLLLSIIITGCASPTAQPSPVVEQTEAPAAEITEAPAAVEQPTQPSAQETAPATEEPAAAPAEELPKIVVTWWSEPNNVDPHTFGTDGDSDARIQGYSTLISKKIVEGPFSDTWLGVTGEYDPMLAESWEEDPDTGAITFKLKDGIVFSNGNPLTAEDVAFTIERGMKSPTSYAGSLLSLAGITDPAQVEALDDLTVRFNIKNGAAPLFYELMSELNMVILDKETIQEHATADDPYATEWLPLNLVGTGAYILDKVEPGVEFVYSPSPTFFDKANYPKNGGVVIKVIPTAADRVLLLKQGEVDVLRGIPYSEIKDLQSSEDIKVLTYPSTDARMIALNNNIAPFDNVDVRRAISYAIPYDQIVETIWAGNAIHTKSVIPEGMPTSDFSVYPYTYDPEKAKQMLADAGYPDGFETTLFTRADNQDDQDMAVMIQDALREIGVTINIEKLLSAAYADRQFNTRDMPMMFFDWISYVNDPYYHLFWTTKCGQGTNYANFCDPEIDKLFEAGQFETDPAKREAISKEIQKKFVDQAPWLFLAQPGSVTAVRSDVKGWAEFPDRIARYWTIWKETP